MVPTTGSSYMGPAEGSRYQLLVEGRDDKWSIINLMMRHGVNWNDTTQPLPFIRDCRGAPNLLGNELSLIVANRSAYEVIGVVLDANSNLLSRWTSVTAVFSQHGFECPAQPPGEGFIAEDAGEKCRIGVWIMPDNNVSGTLETFLGMLIPSDDQCWEYCDTVVNEAKRLGAPFPDKDQFKAKLHSWLAWREEPGIPFGQAITQKCFAADADIALQFVKWFRSLYGISAPPTP